uniref:hypothetical protein n=1 Tax=Nonomuraea sp. CA-251285 TaxID=3240002 RepID=UPI003F495164
MMPRKGDKLSIKVQFQYPGQAKHNRSFIRISDAEAEAGKMGQRGAEVVVTDTSQAPMLVEVAKFGPDVLHLFDWYNAHSERHGLFCRCGRLVYNDLDARSHMTAAGLCWECWGTGAVAERATRDGGLPMAGNLIGCPVCGGSGLDADVSYHDVDTGAFYNRLAMLRLSRTGSAERLPD